RIEDGVSIERREIDVEQQQRVQVAHVQGEQRVQRIAPVAERHEAVAAGPQAVLEQPRQRRVVFHQDHFGRVRRGGGRGRGGTWRSCWSSAGGVLPRRRSFELQRLGELRHEPLRDGAAVQVGLMGPGHPVLGGLLHPGGETGRFPEPVRARRAVDLVGLPAQPIERLGVVRRHRQAVRQLGQHPQLCGGALQVLGQESWRQLGGRVVHRHEDKIGKAGRECHSTARLSLCCPTVMLVLVVADSSAADGWYGLGVALGRLGRRLDAVAALRRAVALAPGYVDAVDQLLAWGVDSGLALPAAPPSPEPHVPARTQGERFEVRTARGWEPFYVKGVNLGAALPGKFPSQFPADDSTYARWLDLIAAANANTVRLYTILPPAFYRALARWNEGHPDHALWLVHGVW